MACEKAGGTVRENAENVPMMDMKRIYSLLFAGFFTVLAACSSDYGNGGNTGSGENTGYGDGSINPNPGAVTYSGNIRVIIQSNCISCHSDPPVNDAPMPLTTLPDLRGAIQSRGLLTRINSTTNPMPPTGLLPRASRQLIENWADLGYPE